MAARRPNILIIQADQLAGPALPMYGNNIVKAPNMEAIATKGLTFYNCYCNNPVCGPSRASMLTGLLSSEVGVYDNGGEFPCSIPTFAHYLRRLGYRTCLSGKMHFVGADQLHGFEERLTTDIYPSDFGWTADWAQQDEPYAPSRMSLRSIVEAGICQRSLQIDYDEEVCYQAEQWLFDKDFFEKDIATKKNITKTTSWNILFLLFASFTHPHNPFITTQEFWDLYDHSKINLPLTPKIPFERQDPWSQRYLLTIRADEHEVTEESIRNARHAYYGMVSYFDSLIGRILKVLKTCNFEDNTYVFVTADHGEMLGERGLWFKFNPFEWSVRVPMLVKGPNVRQGYIEKKGVSLLDLFPTLLDIATDGKSPKLIDKMYGRSLINLFSGNDSSRSDEVMMEYTGEGVYAPAIMLRLDGWKYIYSRTDPAMLFNLGCDSQELNNLAGTSEGSAIEKRMQAVIHERWDYGALEKKILLSQQRRLLVQEALLQGRWTGWDFQPFVDATRAYVRGAIDPNTTATKARRRYPFVAEVPPHHPRKNRRR